MKQLYELWFRMPSKSAIQRKEVTTAIRPGDRRYPNPRGAREGELTRIRILKRPGDEQKGIEPEFDAFETPVRIRKIVVKHLGELEENELARCLPNCQDKERARRELGLIYSREFTDGDIVSHRRKHSGKSRESQGCSKVYPKTNDY